MTHRIRVATAADAGEVANLYRPIVLHTAISFELEPPDTAEMARRITTILERTPWLVWEENGAVLGYAYASRHRDRAAYQWSAEVSAYVRDDARRRGIAAELYRHLFDVLEAQGFYNAYAGITLPNPASVALHTAVGFTPVGVYRNIGFKNGRWHDVAWYERPLTQHSVPDNAPIPLPNIPCNAVTELLNK
jgi:L-amino acid N-acyltransferase YncA